MPCVEWFESQPAEYRDIVLPPAVSARVAVEAAVAQPWYKLVGDTGEIVSIEHYGASADDKTLFREFGFTPEAVVGRRGTHDGQLDTLSTTEQVDTAMTQNPNLRGALRRRVSRYGSTTCPATACRPATCRS